MRSGVFLLCADLNTQLTIALWHRYKIITLSDGFHGTKSVFSDTIWFRIIEALEAQSSIPLLIKNPKSAIILFWCIIILSEEDDVEWDYLIF